MELIENAKNLNEIDQGRFVYQTLVTRAEKMQESVVSYLQSHKMVYYVLWIQNSILVNDVTLHRLEEIEKFESVKSIVLDHVVEPGLEPSFEINGGIESKVEWHVSHVSAPQVWEQGVKGEGILIATCDTGAHYTHDSLIHSYNGYRGNGQFSHDYSWLDAYNRSNIPLDQNNHGSHVTGIAAGTLHGGRKVGIAPDAKWMACRALFNNATASHFIRCLQFFLAPTKTDGTGANPDKRPHITSHSYVCRDCNLFASIQALYAAGVMFVKSCGNAGPSCQTITEPGFYRESICITALDDKDNVTSWASRGPALDGLTKPVRNPDTH
jgi:subtilisin family serine protease